MMYIYIYICVYVYIYIYSIYKRKKKRVVPYNFSLAYFIMILEGSCACDFSSSPFSTVCGHRIPDLFASSSFTSFTPRKIECYPPSSLDTSKRLIVTLIRPLSSRIQRCTFIAIDWTLNNPRPDIEAIRRIHDAGTVIGIKTDELYNHFQNLVSESWSFFCFYRTISQ